MGIVHDLSALALRPIVIHADASGDGALTAQFGEHRGRIETMLERANACAWLALEMALAGDSFWERVKTQLRRNADDECRQSVRNYLDAFPLDELPTEARQQCLVELRTARAEGLLALGEFDLNALAALAGAQDDSAAEPQVLGRLAEEFRRSNLAALSHLLAEPSTTDSHLLVSAYRFFLRQQLSEDEELRSALPAAAASAESEGGLLSLAEALARSGSRIESLLEEVQGLSDADPSELNIKSELPRHGQPIQELGQEVVRILETLEIYRRHLLPNDCLSVDDDAGQRYVRELATQFHGLPDETRAELPALLNGVAMLEALVGDYEDAERDFKCVAGQINDIEDQALTLFSMYVVAIERRQWDEALAHLKEAITRAPNQFAPFPVNKYESQRILGAGGFGVAFLCRQLSDNAQVVVKSLRADGLGRDLADLFRDLEALSKLDHPALLLPRACDYVRGDQQRPYLVLDYFEGQTLTDYVEQHGHLSLPDTKALMTTLAEGLHTAHEQGVFHRDLEPNNLLVRRTATGWEAKLIDFGLALDPRTIHNVLARPAARAHTTLGHSVMRMLEYAAPEQMGWLDGVATGPYSDVYSFGKLCYYALLQTPEPDEDEREQLPEAWRKLLGHCTARALARRLASFASVLERIGQLDEPPAPETQPAAEAPPPPPEAPAQPAAQVDPEQALLKRAQDRLGRGELAPAFADFNRILEHNPKSAGALCGRGDILRLRGEVDKALHDLNQALKIDNKYVQAYINRGRTFRLKGEHDKAVADFTRALKVDPKSADAFNNRGNVHADKGMIDKAIADYNEALKLEPNLAPAYMNRGLAYAKKGNYAAVISNCNEAIKHNPKLVAAYFIRGAAHSSKGEYDKAIADFTRVLRLDPKYALAYNDRGLALAAKGEYDRAIADYNQALRFDPKLALAFTNRAITYRLKGDFNRSIAEMTKLIRVYPKNASAFTNRGLAHLGRHDYDRAIADFTEALWIDENYTEAYNKRVEAFKLKNERAKANEEKKRKEASAREDRERRQSRATAHFTRAQMHFDNGHFDRAVADYGEAIKFDPEDAWTHYHRGLAYAANDEVDKALADYSEALRLDPKSTAAYYHRGVAYRLKGNYARAVADFTEALRLDPKYALAYRNRGLAHAALGEQTKAREDYEEAVRIDPSLGKK